MMRGFVVLLLLATITVVQGVCSFPSELVGSSYQYDSTSSSPRVNVYTFSETQLLIQFEVTGTLVTLRSFNCIERNGDFFMVGNENGFLCYKFISTDNLTPQAYNFGPTRDDAGTPNLCDVCPSLNGEPENILFSEYESQEPYPQQLPVGCTIPTGCPMTTSGTPCTSKPSITLEGFCNELIGILEEYPESSESSSSSSFSEGGGGGRIALRRHMKGWKQEGKKQKGQKQKGKSNSKEKCKKLEALIKETCANVALTL